MDFLILGELSASAGEQTRPDLRAFRIDAEGHVRRLLYSTDKLVKLLADHFGYDSPR